MAEARTYDVIFWGATGFTGQLAAEYVAKHYTDTSLKWAIAGRNQSKLETVKAALCEINPALSSLPLLTGDSMDLSSLKDLAAQTKVICTTVGPYAQYGANMVQACVEEGTHYCDLTGESPFIQMMIDAHHEEAQKNKVKIVHCCGYDSIPSDLGVLFLQQQMKKRHDTYCQEVKYFVGPTRGGVSGGTVASMLNMMEQAQDKKIRRMLVDPYTLYPKDLERGNEERDQTGVRWDDDLQSWTGPFVMAGINARVVRRSHALQGLPYGKDFRYSEVMAFKKGVGGWWNAQKLAKGMMAFVVLAAIKPTRSLLKKTVLPKPGEGPTKKQQGNGFFHTYLVGKKGTQRIDAIVKGNKDPGYGATAGMLAESAICLALDQDKLPEATGITTPATAMGDVLIQRLIEHDVLSFTISETPLKR